MVELNYHLTHASVHRGTVVIKMPEGLEIRFPIARNPRLAKGNNAQLNNIEVSPFGLHWPDLDEDLSFAGLCAGDYGQNMATLYASAGGAQQK